MYVIDHKPALAMMVSSVVSAAATSAPPAALKITVVGPTMFDMVEKWVHLVGAIGGALAGFASATWYFYSFYKARRGPPSPSGH